MRPPACDWRTKARQEAATWTLAGVPRGFYLVPLGIMRGSSKGCGKRDHGITCLCLQHAGTPAKNHKFRVKILTNDLKLRRV